VTDELEQPDAEQPEPEPEPEPAPEPPEHVDDEEQPPAPPEQQAGMTERQLEQAIGKLEKEATRHANRVSEIMGADANELEPCPLCAPALPGFRFPVPPDEDTRAAVFAILELDQAPDYEAADDARACEHCKALGKVLTGSQVPEHVTKLCAHCNGAGWMPVAAAAPGTPATENGSQPAAPAAVAAAAAAEPDAWGRPVGHPHYGQHPAYIT
jgi:hypothetical protein